MKKQRKKSQKKSVPPVIPSFRVQGIVTNIHRSGMVVFELDTGQKSVSNRKHVPETLSIGDPVSGTIRHNKKIAFMRDVRLDVSINMA